MVREYAQSVHSIIYGNKVALVVMESECNGNGLKELQQRLVEMLSSFQKFTQQNGMIFFSGRRKCVRCSQTSGIYTMGRRRGYCNDAGRFRKNGIPDESAA